MTKLESVLSVETWDLSKNTIDFYHTSSNWLFITWFLYGKSEIHHSTKALHFKAFCRSLEQMGETWIELKPYCERWLLSYSVCVTGIYLGGCLGEGGKDLVFIVSCHPGNIITGVLLSLRELYSRVHQIIKISPQNADHHITVPVSAMQGICLLPFCQHPFFHFTYPSYLSCSAAVCHG